MTNKIGRLLAAAALFVSLPLSAATLGSGVERLSYSWHMQGGLSWLTRLAFPSSGMGTLETNQASTVSSRLMINASDPHTFYLYESQMIPSGTTTLMSRSAYSYGDNARDERVAFDPANGVARIQRTSNAHTETGLHKLESATPQDVLTSIYYLRQHADEITMPRQAKIFSGAKGYDVLFVPQPVTTLRVDSADQSVRPFVIKSVGKGEHYPGEVRVWLSSDAGHTPVRIDIEQKYATLKLDLQR